MFQEIKAALKLATESHYRRYLIKHPGEDYYGYALYTDDDVSSIGPVATRSSAIRVNSEDSMWVCYRFGPHEWDDWDDFGLFTEVNAALKAMYASLPFADYKRLSLAAAFEALRELEGNGVFGPRTERRFVVLWLSDSANPIMETAAKELNASSVYEKFASEFGGTI